jgi:hypothetical protein
MTETAFKATYLALASRFGNDRLAARGYQESLVEKAKLSLSSRYAANYRMEAQVCQLYAKYGASGVVAAWQEYHRAQLTAVPAIQPQLGAEAE